MRDLSDAAQALYYGLGALTLVGLHRGRMNMGENANKDAGILALVDLLVDAIEDGIAVAKDGKLSLVEISKFSNLIPDVLPIIENAGLLPDEIKGFNVAVGDDVVTHVVAKLGVTDAKALAIVQAALVLAGNAYALVLAIKS